VGQTSVCHGRLKLTSQQVRSCVHGKALGPGSLRRVAVDEIESLVENIFEE
jgi:hypothetical protein